MRNKIFLLIGNILIGIASVSFIVIILFFVFRALSLSIKKYYRIIGFLTGFWKHLYWMLFGLIIREI